MFAILTRAAAVANGETHYFTGMPCKHGHIAMRFVTSFGCVDCTTARRLSDDKIALKDRVQRWRVENRDKRNAQASRWYASNREKAVGFTRRWQENNPAKVNAGKRRWSASEKGRESQVRWRLANPEKVRATNGRRWARTQEAPGTFSDLDIRSMLTAQRHRCAAPHCRIDISQNYSVDHKMPLSRGGSNWPDNLQLLCASCNSSKRDRTMEEWQSALVRRGIHCDEPEAMA